MRVADLPAAELSAYMQGPGLRVRTGPVVNAIRSPLPEVREGIALHYAQHPVAGDDEFVDFHVSVERPRGLRRWLASQVVFKVDGQDPFTPLPGDQGFAMLEWGLNWCLSGNCHSYLILHAAVLERNGRALLLPAPSGSGKSTLCAGLIFGGWRLLSDELALIDLQTGGIVPVPRPVSLKNASIDVIRRFAPEAAIGRVVHETTKGSVAHVRPPADSVAKADQQALPAWIVRPSHRPGAPAGFESLSKARSMMLLLESSFNHNVHGRRGFNVLADMVEACNCQTFSYGELKDAVAEFDRLATA